METDIIEDLFLLTIELTNLEKDYNSFIEQPYYDGKFNDESKMAFKILTAKNQICKKLKKYFNIYDTI